MSICQYCIYSVPTTTLNYYKSSSQVQVPGVASEEWLDLKSHQSFMPDTDTTSDSGEAPWLVSFILNFLSFALSFKLSNCTRKVKVDMYVDIQSFHIIRYLINNHFIPRAVGFLILMLENIKNHNISSPFFTNFKGNFQQQKNCIEV